MSGRTRALVFDTEANGFFEDGTIVWCLVAKDIITNQTWTWGGSEGLMPYREEVKELFQSARTLICHNLIKHDLPQLVKLGILEPADIEGATVMDTFTISSLYRPDRPAPKGCSGGHGLEAWGVRAGRKKPAQEQWLVWEDNMLHRCTEDVEINIYAWNALKEERASDGWAWGDSVQTEVSVAYIIAEQERNGWEFDTQAALDLVEVLDKELKSIDEKVLQVMPDVRTPIAPIKDFFKKSGEFNSKTAKELGVEAGYALEHPEAARTLLKSRQNSDGIIERFKVTPPNPASLPQIKDYLLSIGWLPDEYTEKKSPRITETSLERLDSDEGKLLARRCIVSARRTNLSNLKNPETKGLLTKVREDGRVSAIGNPMGANTSRFTHKNVVNIPRSTSPFGKEYRSLFTVKEGRRQLGYDASGLELRCLANRMNDPDYTHTLLEGDIHTYNQELAGLPSRNLAKTFIYALLYGAGDLKIGRIVGGNSKDGRALKAKFYNSLPALDALMRNVKTVAKRGWLKGLDGRKIYVRSEHAALNTQLQCDGALVMKYAMLILEDWLVAEQLKLPSNQLYDILYTQVQKVMKVGDIHDESQFDIDESLVYTSEVFKGSQKEAELWMPSECIWTPPVMIGGTKEEGEYVRQYSRVGELAVHAVRQAGVFLQFSCPLDAEYQIGSNWSETH